MAFTKVRGRGVTTTDNYTVGVITATKFVGPITGGGGGINVGVLTATELDVNGSGNISGNLVVEGNLTANGDFTTLNTTLREVELLKVNANSSTTAGIITQTGAGDILNLFDGSTEVLTVLDTGEVGIGTDNPDVLLHVEGSGSTGITFEGSSSNTNALSGDPGTYLVLKNKSATDGNFSNILGTDAGGQATSQISFISKTQSTNAGELVFGTRVASGSMTERLRIESTGDVRFAGTKVT